MSLRLKLNLVLVLISVTGIAFATYFAYTLLHKNAYEEVLNNARIMMQGASAVRSYTADEVRPLLQAQNAIHFLPQSVPTYATHRYIDKLRQEYPEYLYRDAMLNPLNPSDRASDWEAGITNRFLGKDMPKELVGTRDTPTGSYLYISHPIKITDSNCLTCHGVPSAAPSSMLEMYGDTNGFGWKLNEVIGIQIVSVPMSPSTERANATFQLFIGTLIGMFLLVVVSLNIALI